ncbi:MAG: hypothetical protein C0484_18665 [Rhodospirillum sp.]|nr:hypothetical protein [Rhodospirillum sp.]
MVEHAHLQDKIKAAFADSIQPQKDALVRGSTLEASMIMHYFSSRHWEELNSTALANYDSRADLSAVLSFLTPEAVVYYMPSVLLFILERPPGILMDALIRRIKEAREGFTPASYTSQQQQAISDVLAYLIQVHRHDEETVQSISNAQESWRRIAS